MPEPAQRPPSIEPVVAVRLELRDDAAAMPDVAAVVAALGGRIRTLSTVGRLKGEGWSVVEIEVAGVAETELTARLAGLATARDVRPTRALDRVFGKRV